jgi:hypothetical protein
MVMVMAPKKEARGAEPSPTEEPPSRAQERRERATRR